MHTHTNDTMIRHRTAILTALGLIGAASSKAQAPKDLGPYLMADRAAEIALTRTAAPRHISDSATVLVFTRTRFVEAVRGPNGFTCVVLRSYSGPIDDPGYWSPRIRAPHCFNSPASRTVLPQILKEAELVLSGVAPREVMARRQRDFASHKAPSPAPGAITYMLSKEQYLQDVNPHAAPHLMFYYDKAMPPALWGADPAASPVIADADPHARILTLFIPVLRWSDGTLVQAQSSAVDGTEKSVDALAAIQTAWSMAEAQGDTAYLMRLLAPDYRSVGVDGVAHSKSDLLAGALKRRGSEDGVNAMKAWLAAHPHKTSYVIDDNTAVMTYYVPALGAERGITSSDILVYRDHHWQALYSAHTSVKS